MKAEEWLKPGRATICAKWTKPKVVRNDKEEVRTEQRLMVGRSKVLTLVRVLARGSHLWAQRTGEGVFWGLDVGEQVTGFYKGERGRQACLKRLGVTIARRAEPCLSG